MAYDILIDLIFFWFIAFLGWGFGFWAGRSGERERQEMIADLNRLNLIKSQDIYDWRRDGI